MPRITRTHGSAEPAAPQAARPIPRSTPALSPQRALQKARLTGGADLSAEEVGLLHRTVGNRAVQRLLTAPAAPNRTGLPDALKASVERLSGVDLSAVRVHYNSARPARLQALAYTQGADIHVAPGQERHLPHEAWHAVQQAQGRVRPTLQMKQGVQVNDDEGLEHEADVMGEKALQMRGAVGVVAGAGAVRAVPGSAGSTIQLFPAVMPDKKTKGAWTTKTVQVNSQSDFDKFVSQLVAVSKTTGMEDPYTAAIDDMQAQEEKVIPGSPAWKDVVIRAVKAVRTAKGSNAAITVEGIKQAAKAPVKGAKPVEAEPSVNLADLLERCQFKYGNWMKYNEKTGQMASCAVREFPKAEGDKRPDIHATFFLDKNKEYRVVKGVPSMKEHLRLVHLTVENAATQKENTRYWPLDTGKFTGKEIGQAQQDAVKALWDKVRIDLEKASVAK